MIQIMNDKELALLNKLMGISIFLLIGAYHFVMNGQQKKKDKRD